MKIPDKPYGPALSPGDIETSDRYLHLSIMARQIDPHIDSAAHRLAASGIDHASAASIIRYILVYHPLLSITAWTHAIHLSRHLTKNTLPIPDAFDPRWSERHVFDDYPDDELDAYYTPTTRNDLTDGRM